MFDVVIYVFIDSIHNDWKSSCPWFDSGSRHHL